MSYTNGLDKPSDYFSTKLFTGDGSSSHAITGVGFQPDWVWIKRRNDVDSHFIYDSVRFDGSNAYWLQTNNTNAEGSDRPLTAFGSDGFTIGSNNSGLNANSSTYASWNWKETATAGFDIVSYTGNGSNPRTISHNLSAVPKMIIVKNRDQGTDWNIYHEKIGNDKTILLNTTDASFSSSVWNSTTPTSSVFSLGANDVNTNTIKYIAYCFAEKKGFSRFGSFQGNGSNDGSYIHLGFKPAFLIIRRTDDGDNWVMFDNKRNEFNLTDKRLYPNSNAAEATASSVSLDLLSNGFKLRGTDSQINNASGSYIYMAFAEAPFVTSTGIPTTAR